MKKSIIAGLALLLTLVFVGATNAAAEERRRQASLKNLGLKAYWSVLRDDQKDPAKQILADYLVDSAPQRLAAAARLMRYRADVAAVLTPEQRKGAWKLRRALRRLEETKRREIVEKLLESTDRSALADRVERLAAAAPKERIDIGIEILDQVYATIEPRLAEKLALSEDQRDQLRVHYEALRKDIRPMALSLAEHKITAVGKALVLLDEDQKAKLEHFKTEVQTRILDFIRG